MKRKIKFENIRPNVDLFFIIGMSGTGKTTISKKLGKKFNYKLISIDEIIRDIAKNHQDGMKITKLYKPKKYMEEKKKVIKVIKELINKYKKAIIEGTVWDPYIIKQIANTKPYKLIYVKPGSYEQYEKNIMKRVKYDIKNNTKKIAIVWKSLSKKDIYDKKKLKHFIKKLVKYRLDNINDDYKIFKNLKMYILEN